jgi:hypothetical protein
MQNSPADFARDAPVIAAGRVQLDARTLATLEGLAGR